MFATTQKQLRILKVSTCGHFTKKQIREIAKIYNLDVAYKPDSQDICFIPDGNYRDFIKKNISNSIKKRQY